jgi:hypothetical protein
MTGAEIRRITVLGQPRQKSLQDPIQKATVAKSAGEDMVQVVEWLPR